MHQSGPRFRFFDAVSFDSFSGFSRSLVLVRPPGDLGRYLAMPSTTFYHGGIAMKDSSENTVYRASEYVRVASLVEHLRLTPPSDSPEIMRNHLQMIGELFSLLERLGLTAASAAATRSEELSYRARSKKVISMEDYGHIREDMARVLDVLFRTTHKRNLLLLNDLTIDRHIDQLRQQHSLTESQKYLLKDTEVCLQTGAYRAAIVSGWNVCYDLIRCWVCADQQRLSDFNAQVQRRTQRSGGQGHSVTSYDDFFRHSFTKSESTVLEMLRLATGSLGVFTDQVHGELEGLLDQRNKYAHAAPRHSDQGVRVRGTLYRRRLRAPFCVSRPHINSNQELHVYFTHR